MQRSSAETIRAFIVTYIVVAMVTLILHSQIKELTARIEVLEAAYAIQTTSIAGNAENTARLLAVAEDMYSVIEANATEIHAGKIRRSNELVKQLDSTVPQKSDHRQYSGVPGGRGSSGPGQEADSDDDH